ncbi:HEPN domain-containing protein [bacterium]|nr:HEPN domain-containing protein [bacterium]MBU1958581.1 HEPN domain-containing protein [bacterium]
MKDETKLWLDYAEENYKSAKILLDSHLYNSTLQSIQQSIEKDLKALFIEHGIKQRKTHNISILIEVLKENNMPIDIDDDEIDLLDAIYLSSKYPIGSALPDFYPDTEICTKCLGIAYRVKVEVRGYLE